MNRSEMLEKMHAAAAQAQVQRCREIALEYARSEKAAVLEKLKENDYQRGGGKVRIVDVSDIDAMITAIKEDHE